MLKHNTFSLIKAYTVQYSIPHPFPAKLYTVQSFAINTVIVAHLHIDI